ncbi:hypothetical protein Tco_1274946 [Tanacetum coccineum]
MMQKPVRIHMLAVRITWLIADIEDKYHGPKHLSDTKVLTMKMEILLEPTSNKLLEILLKMNLPDHRIKQRWRWRHLVPVESIHHPMLTLNVSKLVETETKLEWALMERDMAKRRLHVSQGWNKRFYMEMVRIRVIPKPPSDDEDTERPRKKSKNSPPSGTESLLSHMDHLVTLSRLIYHL